MKKVKISFFVVVIMLLTGCTAEYNLNIDEDTNFEELVVSTTSKNADYENVKNYYWPKPIDYKTTGYSESPEKLEGVVYYNFNSNSDEDTASFSYDHYMGDSQLKNSAIIRNCYTSIEIIENEENAEKVLRTSDEFLCFSKYPPLEEVKVNIKTNKRVLTHNADEVKGNIYTWNITKNNQSKKSIYISTALNESSIVEEDDNNFLIVIIAVSAFLVLIIGLIVYKNVKYNRK